MDISTGRLRLRRAAIAAGAVASVVLASQLAAAAPARAATAGNSWLLSDATSEDKVVTYSCIGRIVASGGIVRSGQGRVLLTTIGPTADLGGGTVAAEEQEGGFNGAWELGITVVCATPLLAGYEVVTALRGPDSAGTKSATAVCPPGKRLLGAGAEIVGGKGEVALDDLHIAPNLQSATVTGVEDDTGYAGAWQLVARAVCVNPLPGQQLVTRTSTTHSGRVRVVNAPCPAGTAVFGLGARLDGAVGQARLTAVMHDEFRHGSLAVATEDASGHAGTWSLTGYAICANVPDDGRESR